MRGVFFCKKSAHILNTVSVFLFYILLIWGCLRTQRTHPCLRAWPIRGRPPATFSNTATRNETPQDGVNGESPYRDRRHYRIGAR